MTVEVPMKIHLNVVIGKSVPLKESAQMRPALAEAAKNRPTRFSKDLPSGLRPDRRGQHAT